MKRAILVLGLLLTLAAAAARAVGDDKQPTRLAIVGLSHDHVHPFITNVLKRTDVRVVGIVEKDPALAAANATRFHLDSKLLFRTLADIPSADKPQAVAIFTSTFDHKSVVEECAARGIDVMMEKPLAVSMEHALAMQAAVKRSGIRLVVNYETTWYPANQEVHSLISDPKFIGGLRKIVVHDGHRGPKEIGASPEFLAWLTDPVLNGGGALTDFGCYGADLITWLMNGERPVSVTAVTQQIKPDIYPKVDDEATIVLTYPKTQGIIQASWNWPIGRKDMEIYGETGQVLVPRADALSVRTQSGGQSQPEPRALTGPQSDSISYLVAVVRGEIKPSGLSSLETNLIVTEILDAARESAHSGKRVDLPTAPPWR